MHFDGLPVKNETTMTFRKYCLPVIDYVGLSDPGSPSAVPFSTPSPTPSTLLPPSPHSLTHPLHPDIPSLTPCLPLLTCHR